MRQIIFAAAALAFVGGAPALAAEDAAWSMNETSWEIVHDGRTLQETIDAKGNYVVTAGTQHLDHGTIAMKDGKVCSTSAMTQEGERCWTVPKLKVGESGEAVNDKGVKATVKRVAYVAPAG